MFGELINFGIGVIKLNNNPTYCILQVLTKGVKLKRIGLDSTLIQSKPSYQFYNMCICSYYTLGLQHIIYVVHLYDNT